MEEIAESVFRSILSAIRWILWDILIELVIFNIGRGFLLLVTLGKYPRGSKVELDETLIIFAGIGVIGFVWLIIALSNRGII